MDPTNSTDMAWRDSAVLSFQYHRLLAELAKKIPGADLKVTLKTLNAMETGLNRQDARAGSRV